MLLANCHPIRQVSFDQCEVKIVGNWPITGRKYFLYRPLTLLKITKKIPCNTFPIATEGANKVDMMQIQDLQQA